MTTSFAEGELAAALLPPSTPVFAPRAVGDRRASVREACRAALDRPVAAPRLADLVAAAARIAVIVSDATRDEPRAALLEALLDVLPRDRVRLVVATGTHAATASAVPGGLGDLPCTVHDGAADSAVVLLGHTHRGTPIRVARCLVDADLVIATGRVRPHYFAGWSGGVKAIFPGCAHRDAILQNHLLKAHPSARLGNVDDNVCRLDMEEAARALPGRLVALNVLLDAEGFLVAAEYGDVVACHRALVARAADVFRVTAPSSPVVVVADRPPVTASLYQASKLLAPAGPILEPGGTVVLVAECDEGAGPHDRVNRGIYELGVSRQLPAHEVVLVSRLPPDVVARTYASHASSLREALARAAKKHPGALPTVLWRAGESVVSPGQKGRRDAARRSDGEPSLKRRRLVN